MAISTNGISLMQFAVGFCIIGTLLAAMIPSCLSTLSTSHIVEATQNLEKISRSALTYGPTRLATTPMTPAKVPRGTLEIDPDGTWDHPTWKALDFSVTGPHAFSYQVVVDANAASVANHPPVVFHAFAAGDLDGDGKCSSFERRIEKIDGQFQLNEGLWVNEGLE